MSLKNLEQEAKSFNKSRWSKPTQKAKPLTTRRFLAGQAMGGLIARGQTNMKDVTREAYLWADKMLEED
tara:strand:+ start:1291 stop:1497 length:207 start_codon:yes stop_codon:yes gene_type:complete